MRPCEHCGVALPVDTPNCPKCRWWSEAVLLRLLRHSDETVRAQAAFNMVFLDPSESQVLALATALRDPAASVRRQVGVQLFCCGRAEAAVPALIEALDDADVVVQRAAAAALSMVGRPAQAALPKLAELRGVADEQLRQWVREAERRIAG